MIKDTIETAKDFVQSLECDKEMKLRIQRLLSEVRSELLAYDRQVSELTARVNVYAEVCEKMINRAIPERDQY
jgi:hypothetical protein